MPTERDDDLEATQAQVSYEAGLRETDEAASTVDGPPLVPRTGGTFTVVPPRTEVGAIRWTGGNLAEVTAWLRDHGNELVDVDRDVDTVHRLAWRRWTAPSGAPCSRVRVGDWIVEDRVHPTWLHALDDAAFRAGYAAVSDPAQLAAPPPARPTDDCDAAVIERCGDDAVAWASEFMRVHRVLAGRVGWLDEGTMTGWFANAIERACEVRERRRLDRAARDDTQAEATARGLPSSPGELDPSVVWSVDSEGLALDGVLKWLRDMSSVVSCEAVVGPDQKVSHVAVRYKDSRGMVCFFVVGPGDTLRTPDGVRIVVQRADGATYAPPMELQQLGPTSSDPTEDEVRAEPMLQLFRHSHLREGELRDTSYAFCALALQVARLPRNPERTVALRKLREAKDCAVTSLLWKDAGLPPT